MAYQSEVSRDNPTCFVFVIDQSGSMDEKTESGRSKAAFLSDVINRTLYTLITNCTKADGVRNYFDIGVVAYGGAGVTNGFGGELGRDWLHQISKIESSPLRVEDRIRKIDDGAGGVIDQKTKFPVWVDPTSGGGTPMRQALIKAAEISADWCDTHKRCFPPTILHVTDGESTDGSPEDVAEAIRKLHTDDGEALLFNLHVTSSGGREVIFPTSESNLSDSYSKMLFRMSSDLPDHHRGMAANKGYTVDPGSKGFIFNGDARLIVDFFEIGTRPRLMAER